MNLFHLVDSSGDIWGVHLNLLNTHPPPPADEKISVRQHNLNQHIHVIRNAIIQQTNKKITEVI